MSDVKWELEVKPTPTETYAAMTLAGMALLSTRQRALYFVQSLFIGACAPVGATMIFWVIVLTVSGKDMAELPAWGIPVAFVISGMLGLWIMRQAYFLMAVASSHSRFGRAQQITLDRSGITIATANSRWQTGWTDVESLRSGKTVIAVGISGIAIVIPRRVFLGPQDADDAYSCMQSWVEATR